MSGLLKACNGGGDAPIDLTENLVAHYLLNNNADDSFGTNDGTPSGGVDFQGDSASFDGVDDKIVSTISHQTSWTISLWIRTTDTDTSDFISLGRDTWGSSRYGVMIGYGPYFSIFFGNGSSWVGIDGFPTTTPTDGNLHNIVITKDNLTVSLYCDGIHEKELILPSDAVYQSDSFRIAEGMWGSSTKYYRSGKLSNIRYYNDAKPQAFITALYEEGYYPKPLPLPTTDGLLAHYPLTGTAEDATGNYDGTEVSMSYADDSEFGSVADFDGTISKITSTIPNQTDHSTLSFSCWFNSDVAQSGIINQLFRLGNIVFSFDHSNASFKGALALRDSSYAYNITTPYVFTPSLWYFVGFTIADTTLSMYINGVFYDSFIWDGTHNQAGTYDFVLGDSGTGTSHFNGNVKEFRRYSSTLTATEITDIYNYEKNFRPIDIDDGLVAYYPLANNSLDNYYNEYDGTDTAMTYDGLSGVFNGSNSHITLPFDDSIFDGDYSFSCFYNAVADGTTRMLFYNYNAVNAFVRLDSIHSSGDFQFVHRDNVGNHNSFFVTRDSSYDDKTVHMVITKTDSLVTMYIDGVAVGTCGSTSNTYSNTSTSVLLGKQYNAATYFKGLLAKSRFYNKAITAEQVEVIYNTEKGDFI